MTAAAAWSDVEALGEGIGLWPRTAVLSPEFDTERFIAGDPGIDREGGKEFRSGAIADWELLLYGDGIGDSQGISGRQFHLRSGEEAIGRRDDEVLGNRESTMPLD